MVAARRDDDDKLDRMGEHSFPARDAPGTTPPPGTRRAEQCETDAAAAGGADPKRHPTSDRYHGETVAGRRRGVEPAEKDQGPDARP